MKPSDDADVGGSGWDGLTDWFHSTFSRHPRLKRSRSPFGYSTRHLFGSGVNFPETPKTLCLACDEPLPDPAPIMGICKPCKGAIRSFRFLATIPSNEAS